MTNYVSAVPLKELGLGLGMEHLSDEQAQELTDDYSLPALKVDEDEEFWNPSVLDHYCFDVGKLTKKNLLNPH